APADVHVVATGKDAEVYAAADQLVGDLERSGLETIYDDRRRVSPGVKFKDAELVGVPTIVVVGKGLADGLVEIKDRASDEREHVRVDAAVDRIVEVVRA